MARKTNQPTDFCGGFRPIYPGDLVLTFVQLNKYIYSITLDTNTIASTFIYLFRRNMHNYNEKYALLLNKPGVEFSSENKIILSCITAFFRLIKEIFQKNSNLARYSRYAQP